MDPSIQNWSYGAVEIFVTGKKESRGSANYRFDKRL